MNIKCYLIILTSVLLVFWIQTSDKHNNKKENKENIINKIKLPTLVGCLVGLILLVNDNTKCITSEINLNVIDLKKTLPTKVSPDIYTEQPNF